MRSSLSAMPLNTVRPAEHHQVRADVNDEISEKAETGGADEQLAADRGS